MYIYFILCVVIQSYCISFVALIVPTGFGVPLTDPHQGRGFLVFGLVALLLLLLLLLFLVLPYFLALQDTPGSSCKQSSLGICGILVQDPPPNPLDLKIHGCSSPLYKMVSTVSSPHGRVLHLRIQLFVKLQLIECADVDMKVQL